MVTKGSHAGSAAAEAVCVCGTLGGLGYSYELINVAFWATNCNQLRPPCYGRRYEGLFPEIIICIVFIVSQMKSYAHKYIYINLLYQHILLYLFVILFHYNILSYNRKPSRSKNFPVLRPSNAELSLEVRKCVLSF